MYAEAVSVIGKASCLYCEKEADSIVASPNTVYTEYAKYLFADNYHQAVKTAHDICGGIADTIPTYGDWNSPGDPSMVREIPGRQSPGLPTETQASSPSGCQRTSRIPIFK